MTTLTQTGPLNGFVHDMPEDKYHAHRALSSTAAKKMVKSAAHYKDYMDHPHETKAEFELGSAVHTKVLGVGADITVYPDGVGHETFVWEHEVKGELVSEELTNVLASNGAISTAAAKAFAEQARKRDSSPSSESKRGR